MTQELMMSDPVLRPRDACEGVAIIRAPMQGDDPNDSNNLTNGLFSLLSWKRPFDSSAEELFAQRYLDVHPLMHKDGFGNRHMHIPYGDGSPCLVMWSSHIDTCHHDEGYQRLAVLRDNDGMAYLQTRRGEGNCLGADDGTGVWLMLEMIRAGKPGYYIFHRGEEKGCLGSRWLKDNKPELLKRFTAAIALDRKDFDNIITHQGGERGCSEAFATAIGVALKDYKADPTGAYTDTKQYFELIPECTNLSVGYQSQHGPLERQYITHALALRRQLIAMDVSKLPIERDPTKREYRSWGGYGNSAYNGNNTNYHANSPASRDWDPNSKFPNSIAHHPCGRDLTFATHAWSREEKKDVHKDLLIWCEGRGYVLKSKVLVEHGGTMQPGQKANVTRMVPRIIDVPEDSEEELDDEEIEQEMFDRMFDDSNKTMVELVRDYPLACARLMVAMHLNTFDLLSTVYGEERYTAFLDEVDMDADEAAGIVPDGEDDSESGEGSPPG